MTVAGNPALPGADTTSRGSQTRGRLGEGGARDRGNQADDAVSSYPHEPPVAEVHVPADESPRGRRSIIDEAGDG